MSDQSIFTRFPNKEILLEEFATKGLQKTLLVNGHFHTHFR